MTHKILVVDDDDALREMVGLVLSSNGYQPVFASDGISAVEVFKQVLPGLLLYWVALAHVTGLGGHVP